MKKNNKNRDGRTAGTTGTRPSRGGENTPRARADVCLRGGAGLCLSHPADDVFGVYKNVIFRMRTRVFMLAVD